MAVKKKPVAKSSSKAKPAAKGTKKAVAKPKATSKPVKKAAKAAPKAPSSPPKAAPAPAKAAKPAKKAPVASTPKATVESAGGISNDAVMKATGRGWAEWFELLDSKNAATLDHRGIVTLVAPELKNPDWWGQMITVAYEQARGLRVKHERPDGFQIGASKIIEVSVSRIYAAFFDETIRKRWLSDPVTIKKAQPDRSLRLAWADNTPVEVMLFSKGETRASVAVQHSKLKDEDAANRMKQFWKSALERLTLIVLRNSPPSTPTIS